MPRSPRSLSEYRRKRDFSRTAEPAGGAAKRAPRGTLRFVIQKHAATRLHFDLRLELDGVMKSWAVPKGPSLDPGERRLAMQVEDHPIEYNTFEGIIPAGEYGGGTVMLWDRGTYTASEADDADATSALRRGYHSGRLKITFHGKRLRGGYTLVRMRPRDEDAGKPAWLFIKERDEHADPARDIVAEEDTSIATHRTMEQIAAGRSRRWTRKGGAEPAAASRGSKSTGKGKAKSGALSKSGTKKSGRTRTATKKTAAPRTATKKAPAKRSVTKAAAKGTRKAAAKRSTRSNARRRS